MDVELVYPPASARTVGRRELANWSRWPFTAAVVVCPVINIVLGGKAWSVVVLWGLWMVWSFTFSPNQIGVNRIGQVVKAVTDVVVLMFLIDLLLAPGWADTVVPIVCFASLAVVGTLFFTDLDRQRHNIVPMVALSVLCLISAVVVLAAWQEVPRWPLIVLVSLAVVLLVATFAVMGRDFLRAVVKFFHM